MAENTKKAGEAGGSGSDDGGIKCKYMRAAQGFLGNTTFHGISWVLEEVSAWAKLAIVAYFTFMFICALYSVITAVSRQYLLELQMNLREDLTITEKACTSACLS